MAPSIINSSTIYPRDGLAASPLHSWRQGLSNTSFDQQITNISLNSAGMTRDRMNVSFDGNVETSTEYEDYDYSLNMSYGRLPVEEAVSVGMVYGLTLLLGFCGNLLVIVSILRYRRMQNITNIFLTSLATADLLLVVLCVPVKFAKWLTFTWTFGEVLCKLVHYLQNVSVTCSILTLTTISLERYYAIIHPMKAKYVCTKRRAKRVIGVVWLMSFIVSSPLLIGQKHKRVGVRVEAHWCVKEWPEIWQDQLYELSSFTLIFILPLCIITFAYSAICREMMRMTSQRAVFRTGYSSKNVVPSNDVVNDVHSATSSVSTTSLHNLMPRVLSRIPQATRCKTRACRDDAKTRKQVIKMLLAIIFLFSLCWGPALIDQLLVAFRLVERLNYGHLKPMRQAFSLLGYINSCLNPIIYAFMSQNFRKTFLSTLRSFLTWRRGRAPGNHPLGVNSHEGSVLSRPATKMTLSTSIPGLLSNTETAATLKLMSTELSVNNLIVPVE